MPWVAYLECKYTVYGDYETPQKIKQKVVREAYTINQSHYFPDIYECCMYSDPK